MSPFDPCLHGPSTRRRAVVVGRIALYSVTVFLGTLLLIAPATYLLLVTSLDAYPLLLLGYRVLLAVNLLSGVTLFIDLFLCQRFLVPARDTKLVPTEGSRVHVALTAFNDEVCIGEAVRDFKHSLADRLIVVENASTDQTAAVALAAGADEVVTETRPGYGACCMRALEEASKGLSDADIIVLCEGDLTFVAHDLAKLMAFIPNADLILGTRATQELRRTKTQMDWLINPANQIVAKLIQTRFWGTRLTDVGCTYRAIRVAAYRKLRDRLWVEGNHFSPHMYIEALKLGMRVIEIPVSFGRRGGVSKGVGSNKIKAAGVALRTLAMLYRS